MMWVYAQDSGCLFHAGELRAVLYSGKGAGKNNPLMQQIKNVGPIPCGIYDIGGPVNTHDHGPYVLILDPRADNHMFGRAGFLFHGDSKAHMGQASEGCIVGPFAIRQEVHLSGDNELQVIPTQNMLRKI